MTHTSTRASHTSPEPRDAHTADEAEQSRSAAPQRRVARSEVGWRYGSALAAARALNARPARA